MPRILLLIILLWLLFIVLKYFRNNIKSKRPSAKTTAHNEKIVACSQCGLHIPESESLMIDGKVHCNNPACSKQS